MLIHAKLYGVPADKREGLINELLESVDLLKFRDCAGANIFRRHAAAAGNRARPGPFAENSVSRRTDHRPRPGSRTNVWEMIRALRAKSELTILITTHYMDEADKLCDRIAIVDHGKLAALDTPERLKDSIPGTDVVEAEFVGAPPDWLDQLRAMSQVASVTQRDERRAYQLA